MARAKALTDLGDTDLIERLSEAKEDLFNLRFQFATGQLDNPARLKQVRRDIARMLTELRAREIAAAEAELALEAERIGSD
ncbi:MAG: 50S ribosomal protein L29 [Acidimicrobiaceae bacterium]|nr:50S ribosomal protein L29 [Acidimicrobiaceae bacterium]MXZ99932.1 50S ribosomal protein L29 [Acidimicrobiaceae bacterium]MYE97587.1 50S ribosomal protein L29 [Acidimicrobiaceae bacterium]MYH44795.1 50S ribosomal protein L29 [Acidimicrobiaceae bacterium]MYI52766.1 50S ribosomal protein L29 [Acidimicrobiaceae bacterium]